MINLQSPLSLSPLVLTAHSSKTPTETLSIAEAPGTIFNALAYNFSFGGTATPGDTISVTFSDIRFLPSGSRTVSYTVQPGDNIDSVAYGFAQVMDNDAIVQSLGIHSRNYFGGPLMPVGIPTPFSGPDFGAPPGIGITSSLASTGSETLAITSASDENKNVTVSGAVTTGDVIFITVKDSSITGGSKTIYYTVLGGSTTTSIAGALASAISADATLQAAGISAYSTGPVLTVVNYTYFTASVGSGTESLTISQADRGSALVTVGGAVTPGDTLSIVVLSAKLTGGQTSVSYTVQSTDTLQTIAQNLTAAINTNANLQSIAVTSKDATIVSTQLFSSYADLPPTTSLVRVGASDGSSASRTNSYAMSVNSGSTINLTFDLNGNMLSDGTNSYSWDAENRMIKITYPGTNNFSTFVYDGLRRTAKITETVAGSVASTKQFVWSELSMREERDASGALTKKFFERGQMNSATKLFYALDHLGSVRDLADNSGVLQAQYAFDPFGQATKLSESVPSDLGYGYYYLHSRSGLNLALYRSYSSSIGRWLNRDPIEEQGGNNLFAYVANKPIRVADPLGLQGIGMIPMVPAVPMVPNGPMAAGGPPVGGQPSPGCMKLCWASFIMCQERCIQQFLKD